MKRYGGDFNHLLDHFCYFAVEKFSHFVRLVQCKDICQFDYFAQLNRLRYTVQLCEAVPFLQV